MKNERLLKVVASNIKRARQAEGLIQQDLVKFGFNIRHYQDIESGTSNLTLKTLARVADAFGIPLFELTRVDVPKSADDKLQEVYRNYLSDSSLGIIIWELDDLTEPTSFRLIEFNKQAGIITSVDLKKHLGEKMLDIFPASRELNLHNIYHQVAITGKTKRLSDVMFKEKNSPFCIYSIFSTRCAPKTVGILFEDVTESRMAENRNQGRTNLFQTSDQVLAKLVGSQSALKQEVNQLLDELGRPRKYIS